MIIRPILLRIITKLHLKMFCYLKKVNDFPFVYLFCICFAFASSFLSFGQVVPIQNYSIDENGRVLLSVNSISSNYYFLQVRHHPDSSFSITSSMTLGQVGTTIISEPLSAYPLSHYRVLEKQIGSLEDIDGDGIDDFTEYNSMPNQAPLNTANTLQMNHGLISLNSMSAFNTIATNENNTPWVEYLNDVAYTKFLIADFDSDFPKVYFINSNSYSLHVDFANFLGIDHLSPSVKKGQLIYRPSVLADNGTLGTFSFNFSNNEAPDFSVVQRTHELIASNMPFLNNNLSYFITENNEQDYQENLNNFNISRVPVLFESDVYAGINYWGLHQSEGFGFLRIMTPGEIPNARDIVLYDIIPNTLPRVGGIITSMIQTPLSHVNLRAIHDNVPNAFIRNPLENNLINNLVGGYVYFKTNQSSFEIREATLVEVNAWFENIRPKEELQPPLNLSYQKILPLDSIKFEMFDGFGAKAANVATMRTFDFSEETIPDGYGVPFYFYQEFMKYNGFHDQIQGIITDSAFKGNRAVREIKLKEIRSIIKTGNMPDWMLQQLLEMQQSFPIGTSIRCRSSSNNEDLPGFNGAGLYDSKTQHPNEGHISKSIKQVYASLWNLRAFEEREFYRVNHFSSSMGVLCHPNFENEKVNGVGVTSDPIYDSKNKFYINSQLGEFLITNPTSTYPEEILLNLNPTSETNFDVIQYSSLVNGNELLLTIEQLSLLKDYMTVIHETFAKLYEAETNPTFAMDIEYKIDSLGKLVIKQARPWVAFVPEKKSNDKTKCDFSIYPNPASDLLNFDPNNSEIEFLIIADLNGKSLLERKIENISKTEIQLPVSNLSSGIYLISAISNKNVCKSKKFIKL